MQREPAQWKTTASCECLRIGFVQLAPEPLAGGRGASQGTMPPRAWHSGVREAAVESTDPLQPSDMDGLEDVFELFSQPPDPASPARSIQIEPNINPEKISSTVKQVKTS